MIDYATTLVRHKKETKQARELIEQAKNKEMSELAKPFVFMCQGIIEIEEKNFPKAEFYLSEAAQAIKPFAKNIVTVPVVSVIKAYSSIALANNGKRENARQLFAEAEPFLSANRENELLQQCREALA